MQDDVEVEDATEAYGRQAEVFETLVKPSRAAGNNVLELSGQLECLGERQYLGERQCLVWPASWNVWVNGNVWVSGIPLLCEEGWTRHKQKWREASSEGADGVVAYE